MYWDNGKENGNYYDGFYRDDREYIGDNRIAAPMWWKHQRGPVPEFAKFHCASGRPAETLHPPAATADHDSPGDSTHRINNQNNITTNSC